MNTLTVFTLVLDGYRFLPHQFFTLSRLTIPWRWIVVHGAAANTGTTSWCKLQKPRLSRDGSTEFLRSLEGHPNVLHIDSPWWPGGKDQMVRVALNTIKEPTILMQVDADELWESWQLSKMFDIFITSKANCARFDCEYMVGPNLKVIARDCWGQNKGEWLRAWKFTPGQTMTHEPPFLRGVNEPENEKCFPNSTTRGYGLVFRHWAYAFEDQIAFKRDFYGYPTALDGWRRLQAYRGPFPTPLRPFFPWVNGNPLVDQLYKPRPATHKRNPGDGQP